MPHSPSPQCPPDALEHPAYRTADDWVGPWGISWLHRWREGEQRWTPIADLSEFGVTSATRIAVSPDGKRVAIVGVPAE